LQSKSNYGAANFGPKATSSVPLGVMATKTSYANMCRSKAAKRRIRSCIVKTSRWNYFEGFGFWGLDTPQLAAGSIHQEIPPLLIAPHLHRLLRFCPLATYGIPLPGQHAAVGVHILVRVDGNRPLRWPGRVQQGVDGAVDARGRSDIVIVQLATRIRIGQVSGARVVISVPGDGHEFAEIAWLYRMGAQRNVAHTKKRFIQRGSPVIERLHIDAERPDSRVGPVAAVQMDVTDDEGHFNAGAKASTQAIEQDGLVQLFARPQRRGLHASVIVVGPLLHEKVLRGGQTEKTLAHVSQ